ncbi:alpha/beta hydrolase [Conyzicola nivalis]|uniref:Alpha/beta hydrolase n=1 Tax=Conyzicola nivalis TaxID=1477021 RepID=A0A916WHR8_9MICO|nr:alpha/beta hydrolase [Conyzicola nivalis]GGA98738.1 alpha/beta hydrolase [Conyzicola nivalis]
MTEFVTSADGTRIAFDREGDGPPVVLVGGATQFRAFDPATAELARELAGRGFTVVNYDRRGRGESGDTVPFAVDREVEDIAALVAEVGGAAALYGSSSGAALALWAAAAGVPTTALVLWEPPFELEGTGDRDWLTGLEDRIAHNDRQGAAEFFMRDMPPEWLEAAKSSDAWQTLISVAPTMVYDAAALERTQHAPWREAWAAVTVPTLVVVGDQALPIFPPVADALVEALPRATQCRIDSSNHDWKPDQMAKVIADFVRPA